MAYAERRFGAAPKTVLLTGGGGLMPGAAQRVRERVGAEVAPVTAVDLFAVSPAVKDLCAQTPLVLALGLALHDQAGRRAA